MEQTILKPILTGAIGACLAFSVHAQCAFTPSVDGNLLVCPASSTILSTQVYDSYQWLSRPFGSGGGLQPIANATGATLEVSADQVPLHVAVRATKDGCTEQSAEVLVDGLVFLPVTVLTTGEFGIGPNGETVICSGDPTWFVALQPYTQNIQWYRDGEPIAGANNDSLLVNQPGEYWLTASPGDCPEYEEGLGVTLTVVWSDVPGCNVSDTHEPARLEAFLMPNPARTQVSVALTEPGPATLTLVDSKGRIVRYREFDQHTSFYIADLPRGTYSVLLRSEQASVAKRLVILGD
jgi:hypothetical protein